MTGRRILGVDYGEKRVGVALSDSLGLTAQPLTRLDRIDDAKLADALASLVVEHGAERVVVGLPIGLSGASSARARRTRRFVKLLQSRLRVPVVTSDERLSTAEADRALTEMGVGPARRRERRDMISAQIILQRYLERRASQGNGPA